jgi:hypothetical protein
VQGAPIHDCHLSRASSTGSISFRHTMLPFARSCKDTLTSWEYHASRPATRSTREPRDLGAYSAVRTAAGTAIDGGLLKWT